MLPPYDSIATLSDLTVLAMSSRAQEIWCLGDSFHDRDGCNRLPRRAREMLSTLTASTRWTWITGNHDPGFADPRSEEHTSELQSLMSISYAVFCLKKKKKQIKKQQHKNKKRSQTYNEYLNTITNHLFDKVVKE